MAGIFEDLNQLHTDSVKRLTEFDKCATFDWNVQICKVPRRKRCAMLCHLSTKHNEAVVGIPSCLRAQLMSFFSFSSARLQCTMK